MTCCSLLFWNGLTAMAAQASTPSASPEPGEWPCYRRNGTLDARSPARGRTTAPHILWKQFVGARQTPLLVTPQRGKMSVTLPTGDVPGHAETADPRWGLSPPPAELEGRRQPVRPDTGTTYAHVLPDVPDLQKLSFESGFSKPTVNGQWQPCVGRCFAWRGGRWVPVWETEPFPLLFVPLPLVGDFDGDGRWHVTVHDGITGAIRANLPDEYLDGVVDLDGDGVRELLTRRTSGGGVPEYGTIVVRGLAGVGATAPTQRE